MIRRWIDFRIKWASGFQVYTKSRIFLLTIAKSAGQIGKFFHIMSNIFRSRRIVEVFAGAEILAGCGVSLN
jgi:hypothetical protein